MASKTALVKLNCSLCDRRIQRKTRGEAISAMHKHWIKEHPLSLSRRIKKGMKKAKNTNKGDNPAWLEAIMTGIFPPANIPSIVREYKAMNPGQRNLVKGLLTALTIPVGGGASAIAGTMMKALDIVAGES